MEKLQQIHGIVPVKAFTASLFFSAFLIPSNSNGQEKFQLSTQSTKEILKSHHLENAIVFNVTKKNVEYKKIGSTELVNRSAYLVSGMSMPADTLNGNFEKLPEHYHLVITDVDGQYVKDELVIKEFVDTREMTAREFELIQKADTEEYYLIYSDDKLVPILAKEQQNKEILAIANKQGYKEYKNSYGQLRIKSKTSDIALDDRTYAELKKDPSYITKLDADQQKISVLVKQTIPHSKTLDKYLSTYNVQRRRMSTADLNAWRTATGNAQKLHNQIYAISKKYDGNTSFTLLDKSNTLNNFLDNLNASKGVLGM